MLDILEADLSLQNSYASINVQNLNNKWGLIIVDLKLQIRVTISRRRAFGGSSLTMLVSLITDNMTVFDVAKILSSNHCDIKHAHWTLNIVAMGLFSLSQRLLCLLQSRMVRDNVLLYLLLSFNELVLCFNVLLREFVKIDPAISILVKLFKDFIDDLRTVLVVNASLCQVLVHLVTLNLTISIHVHGGEGVSQLLLFTLGDI